MGFFVHWKSGEDRKLSYRLLLIYLGIGDFAYFECNFQYNSEKIEFDKWLLKAQNQKIALSKVHTLTSIFSIIPHYQKTPRGITLHSAS